MYFGRTIRSNYGQHLSHGPKRTTLNGPGNSPVFHIVPPEAPRFIRFSITWSRRTETRQFKEIETLFFLTRDGVEGPDQKMVIRHTASVDKLETIYIKYFTLISFFFCTL